MRYDQDPDPNGKSLVYRTGDVDTIKQLPVLVLNRLPSNIALGGGARKSAALDNDNMFGGSDTLLDVVAVVELSHSLNDFLFELLDIHRALLRNLDKQGGTYSAFSDDYAVENEFTTCSANPVLDRPEVVDLDKHL